MSRFLFFIQGFFFNCFYTIFCGVPNALIGNFSHNRILSYISNIFWWYTCNKQYTSWWDQPVIIKNKNLVFFFQKFFFSFFFFFYIEIVGDSKNVSKLGTNVRMWMKYTILWLPFFEFLKKSVYVVVVSFIGHIVHFLLHVQSHKSQVVHLNNSF